jgi:hypothetical protein
MSQLKKIAQASLLNDQRFAQVIEGWGSFTLEHMLTNFWKDMG